MPFVPMAIKRTSRATNDVIKVEIHANDVLRHATLLNVILVTNKEIPIHWRPMMRDVIKLVLESGLWPINGDHYEALLCWFALQRDCRPLTLRGDLHATSPGDISPSKEIYLLGYMSHLLLLLVESWISHISSLYWSRVYCGQLSYVGANLAIKNPQYIEDSNNY